MDQIEKNTVSADNQIKESDKVSYINQYGKGKRILFVGNSITRHGSAPEIGWYNDFGMAASCKENDYVHLLVEKIKKTDNDAVFCVCQVSNWESKYKTGNELLGRFVDAGDFNADVIVLRLIENCPIPDFDHKVFYNEYKRLVEYLNNSGKADVILTTGFWKHPGDSDIRCLANDCGYKCAELGDLGEDDSMKAIGLFEHSGVANHPNDNGMRAIADRIFELMS